MCECKSTVEAKLLDREKQLSPDAEDLSVELADYAFILGKSVSYRPKMDAVIKGSFPLKKGGMRTKKIRKSVVTPFCPWCGEKQ